VKIKISYASADDIRRACLMVVFAGLVAGCTPRISPPAAVEHSQAPADFPESYYQQAEAPGKKFLRVDPDRSLVVIVVRRDGPLARLGHDHVVASHDVRGYVDMAGDRADLYIPLDRLEVDEPNLRSEAGLTTQPSEEAVEGTRHNMLERVLESGRFPFALMRITRRVTDRSKLSVTIALHGTMHTFEIPAQIETLPGGIEISGQLMFNQTDFGITPFSILGGALQVQDRLDLRFRIFAGGS